MFATEYFGKCSVADTLLPGLAGSTGLMYQDIPLYGLILNLLFIYFVQFSFTPTNWTSNIIIPYHPCQIKKNQTVLGFDTIYAILDLFSFFY